MMNKNDKEQQRTQRERDAIELAKQLGRSVSYDDDDGCEITVTPQGHVFYNVVDWW
jgi:hypothetical protein